VPLASLSTFRAIEGVQRAEGLRVVPARFEMGARQRTATITGYAEDHDLRALRDLTGHRESIPAQGMVLTQILGERLGVRVGEHVRVVVLDGERRTLSIPVAGFVNEPMGMAGHMELSALHRLLAEPESINTVLLAVDPLHCWRGAGARGRHADGGVVRQREALHRAVRRAERQVDGHLRYRHLALRRRPSPSAWSTTTRASR
jgi:hypothetical protein